MPDAALRTIQDRVAGTSINARTLLATDYLNHFNEIAMILDIVADCPEVFDEARGWAPKSYRDHFLDSGIADRVLAIEAYDRSPPRYRTAFDGIVEEMDRLVLRSIRDIAAAVDSRDGEMVRALASAACRSIQEGIAQASAVIHGDGPAMRQSDIDALWGAGDERGRAI